MGAHILASAIVVYAYIAVTQNPNVTNQVSAFLQHYGLPIGIVNMVIAEAVAWLKGKYDQVQPTLPPATPAP